MLSDTMNVGWLDYMHDFSISKYLKQHEVYLNLLNNTVKLWEMSGEVRSKLSSFVWTLNDTPQITKKLSLCLMIFDNRTAFTHCISITDHTQLCLCLFNIFSLSLVCSFPVIVNINSIRS